MQSLQSINRYLWTSLEEALTPINTRSHESKLEHAMPAVGLLPAALVTGGVVAALHVAATAVDFFRTKEQPDPNQDFSAVCRDSRLWNKIDDLGSKIVLGQEDAGFLFGVATSTFQDSGAVHCPNSQWAEWEIGCLPPDNRSQDSANLFQLYQTKPEEITDRLKKLGVNSYRFSVEWSQIQPDQNTFKQDVLDVYVHLCKHLRDQGIQPMVTLHHFSEPMWFHKLGSFEKEENIEHFVQFAKSCFEKLTQSYNDKPLVEYFCTINEPSIEAVLRYVKGEFSPGKWLAFETAGIFLKTALKAHVAAYAALKPICEQAQIGIVHQPFSLEAANIVVYPITRYLNRLMNDAALKFFKEGVFELKVPFACNVYEKVDMPKTDFVGLQYYARPLVGLLGSTSYHEPMTKMFWREDPEGLYEAIIEAHDSFKAPVIITENGISTHNDEQRSRYMQRALYATQMAQNVIGQANLKGYFAWSFCDNSEWVFGLDPQKFGTYALTKIDGKRVLESDPKPGMDSFIRVAKAWQNKN